MCLFINNGQLKAIKDNRGRYLISESDLKEFIKKYFILTQVNCIQAEKMGFSVTHFTLIQVAQRLHKLKIKSNFTASNVYSYVSNNKLKAVKNYADKYIVTEADLKEFISYLKKKETRKKKNKNAKANSKRYN